MCMGCLMLYDIKKDEALGGKYCGPGGRKFCTRKCFDVRVRSLDIPGVALRALGRK